MLDKPGIVRLVRARVRALLPKHWRGSPGRQVRETVEEISEFSKKNVRLAERLEELPDVLWNTAQLKSSEALVNAADEEQKHIAAELARQTLPDKARQEKAAADRMEAEARITKVKEMEERLALVEKLRPLNVVPVWDKSGSMVFLKAPRDFDWDELTRQLLDADAAYLESHYASTADLQAAIQGRSDVAAELTTEAITEVVRPVAVPSNAAFGTPEIVEKPPDEK